MKNQKKILVTGGTGFIGSKLVRKLVNLNHNVRVADNNSRGKQHRIQDILEQVEYCVTDIRDADSVSRLCKGIDTVFHLAYINGTEYFYTIPEKILEVGVKGIMNVLDGCISNNVKELILVSSSEVYQTPPVIPTAEDVPLTIPDPFNPRYSYGAGKIISEMLAINYGRKYFDRTQIIRPHNVYGPDMGKEHVIPQLILRMCELSEIHGNKFECPIQGTGNETRSFINIDDFVEGTILSYENGGNFDIYHIGTMDAIRIIDLAGLIAGKMDLDVTFIPGAPGITEATGGPERRCPDTTKIQSLGFVPRITLDEGLEPVIKWYKNDYFNKSGRK